MILFSVCFFSHFISVCYWAEFRNIIIIFISHCFRFDVVVWLFCVWLYVLQMNNWTNSIWYYQYNVSMLLPHNKQVAPHTHTHAYSHGATQTCTQSECLNGIYRRTYTQWYKHHPNTHARTRLWLTYTMTQGVRTSTFKAPQIFINMCYILHTLKWLYQFCQFAVCLSTRCECIAFFCVSLDRYISWIVVIVAIYHLDIIRFSSFQIDNITNMYMYDVCVCVLVYL